MVLSCIVCEMATYWSKIAKFFIPHLYLAPRRNFAKMFDTHTHKTKMIGIPCAEETTTIKAVSIEHRNVTNGLTDRQTYAYRQNCYSLHQ